MDNRPLPPLSRLEEVENSKICAFDIDGVLNTYPDPWVRFINSSLGTSYRNLREAKTEVPYDRYRELKHMYRKNGECQSFREGSDIILGAILQTHTVVLITARPFHKYPKLQTQTIEWLEASGICYDYIISSQEKHVEVIRQFPHLKFMVEDNRYIANLVAKWGYKVYLFDNMYNQGDILPNVTRVKSFEEIKI